MAIIPPRSVSSALPASRPAFSTIDTLVILHTNDFHGYISPDAPFATLSLEDLHVGILRCFERLQF